MSKSDKNSFFLPRLIDPLVYGSPQMLNKGTVDTFVHLADDHVSVNIQFCMFHLPFLLIYVLPPNVIQLAFDCLR